MPWLKVQLFHTLLAEQRPGKVGGVCAEEYGDTCDLPRRRSMTIMRDDGVLAQPVATCKLASEAVIHHCVERQPADPTAPLDLPIDADMADRVIGLYWAASASIRRPHRRTAKEGQEGYELQQAKAASRRSRRNLTSRLPRKLTPKRLLKGFGGRISRFAIEALCGEDARRSRLVGAIAVHPTRIRTHHRHRLPLGYRPRCQRPPESTVAKVRFGSWDFQD